MQIEKRSRVELQEKVFTEKNSALLLNLLVYPPLRAELHVSHAQQ
jgi:hypothetical protein